MKDDQIRVFSLLNILFCGSNQLESISLLPKGWICEYLCEAICFVLLTDMGKNFPDDGYMTNQYIFFFEKKIYWMHFWSFYPVA